MNTVVPLKKQLDASPQNGADKSVPAISPEKTEREKGTLAKHYSRRRKAPVVPRIKVSGIKITNDHTDPDVGCALLKEAMGTTSDDFAKGMIGQLVNIGSQGQVPDEPGTNFALAIVGGIAPQDQVEAMLAAQMAAVHMATMTFARRLANVDTIPQQDSAEKTFNKLARTFAAQVEALKRYRSKGEQRVIVERVTVEKGGQAIVGNVAHGGGVAQEDDR
ncbi:hypothetical protein BPNPMPFG_005044 [Mesorhizobium sp. AR07]|uniref:hypothetical protein n=1 Tax=Mesorhizobium sp. AR07 TaxID=2865838 RepID=UPI00215F3A73|nr:hypothetical protein [Mesorhizobium sp. AR07]UVK43266.1 hypothetical protein BPNPMPFG_005044 [Mesorhizobium sp. AR07]